jgi:hypothetical protein
MSRKTTKWTMSRTHTFPDPRLPIAKHIGWERPIGADTDFHVPEPDNYNYAVKADKPMECPHVDFHVYYKDPDGAWWTTYIVTEKNKDAFIAWAEPIEFQLCWVNPRSPKQRTRRKMLWVKKAAPELTLNERLYTMGYFDKFSTKYVDGAGEILTARMGTLRADLPNWNKFAVIDDQADEE